MAGGHLQGALPAQRGMWASTAHHHYCYPAGWRPRPIASSGRPSQLPSLTLSGEVVVLTPVTVHAPPHTQRGCRKCLLNNTSLNTEHQHKSMNTIIISLSVNLPPRNSIRSEKQAEIIGELAFGSQHPGAFWSQLWAEPGRCQASVYL